MKNAVSSEKNTRNHIGNSNIDSALDERIPYLKKALLRKQAELRKFLQSITEERRGASPQKYPDPTDKSDADVAFSSAIRNESATRYELVEIHNALKRIADEEYGYCTDCGEAITTKRLKARPAAERCIDCKTHAERDENKGGGKWSQIPTWR